MTGNRIFGVGHVAEQHVANDAEPLQHVHATANVHVAGHVLDAENAHRKQPHDRDGGAEHGGNAAVHFPRFQCHKLPSRVGIGYDLFLFFYSIFSRTYFCA